MLFCFVGAGMRAGRTPGFPPLAPPSAVAVSKIPGGGLLVKTAEAEFDVLPSGCIHAYLLKGSQRLTLDDPGRRPQACGDYVVIAGKEIRSFTLDFDHAEVSAARSKIGALGKRIEIKAASPASGGVQLEKTFVLEVYDDFPNLAFTTVAYRNAGAAAIKLDQLVTQQHRLNASLADSSQPPYRLWSFQGSSYQWAKDDVVLISKEFSQPNLMGVAVEKGLGGGVPVVAFWTRSVGEAIGHVEPSARVLSLPVNVEADGRVKASMSLVPVSTLKPGEVFSTPRTFVAVYSGDFYEPLRAYSLVLQREVGRWPTPSKAAYSAIWVGWGYEYNFTPAQMLGVIPKLEEFNIHSVQLADRWFEHYGDWQPRPDTFPDDSMKRMVEEFHKHAIRVQIYWHPLVVEDGVGRYHEHIYRDSEVLKHHPDWLILDKDGKRARVARGLLTLCPALPEVQEFHRKLTERFIRGWGFDSQMLDYAYSVPACYNPKHRHKSPEESVEAAGKVYQAIFEAGRAANPQCVTMCCPCGTPPNAAYLPFEDQTITADPLGSAQVRRRIKMYKALLGPEAAVSGDRVELTEVKYAAGKEVDLGTDFASTIGVGGVPETMFVWPIPKVMYKTESITPEAVLLTSQREVVWKKWLGIYNSKMLSEGTYRNLYVLGYDVPEGHAIEKDGRMYYAFFAPEPSDSWKGKIELRGLRAGKYRVFDYVNERDLGIVDSRSPRLEVEFSRSLLLEVVRR